MEAWKIAVISISVIASVVIIVVLVVKVVVPKLGNGAVNMVEGETSAIVVEDPKKSELITMGGTR